MSIKEKPTRVSLADMQIRRAADLLDVQTDGPLLVKDNKVRMRQVFGFKLHEGLNDNYPTQIPPESNTREIEKKRKQVLETIDRELKKGHFLHIRLINQEQKGSGNPVIILGRNSGRISGDEFIREPNNTLDGGLVLDKDNQLIGFNIEDKVHEIDAGMNIDIFSQPVSARVKMSGFDNQKDCEDMVRMGGGFRLEFEGLDERYKPPKFIFKAVIMFDDNSPRSTALNFVKEQKIPQKEVTFLLEFDQKKQKFKLPKDLNTIAKKPIEEHIKNGDVNEICTSIFKTLFENDNQSIIKWLRTVLIINPKERIHSIEGVFSIKRNNGGFILLGPKLISWDGLETYADWINELDEISKATKEIGYSITRHFLQRRFFMLLAESGFINGFFPNKQHNKSRPHKYEETLEIFTESQKSVEHQTETIIAVNTMLEEANLEKEIAESIIEHLRPGYLSTFSNERTGPRLLGELFKTISKGEPDSNWNPIVQIHKEIDSLQAEKENSNSTDIKHLIDCEVWQQEIDNNKLIFISINGFALGYWIENGILIQIKDLRDLKDKSEKIADLLNVPIVDAVFGNLHEGD